MFYKKDRNAFICLSVAIYSALILLYSINEFSEISAIPATAGEFKPSLATLTLSGLRAGLLTFGGAYAVIPYLQNDAVLHNGWMTGAQFMDGIALSGILPAPLIIFSTFVGFAGAGIAGAVTMTLAIFAPAFSFTLLGHELLEKVIDNPVIHDFLEGVTAAVVGLIAATSIVIMIASIKDLVSLAIFICALALTYILKGSLSILLIIISSGIAGFFLFN